jgi:hypothetical protein
MRTKLAALLVLPLLTSSTLFSQQDAFAASAAALRAKRVETAAGLPATRVGVVTSCESQITCGQTVDAALVADCQFQDGTAIDLFQFNGTAGQTVTINASSTDFPPFFDLEQPVTFASEATGQGTPATPATATAVLDTAGTWTIGVTSFGDAFQAGNYTLSLACSDGISNPGCSADPNTLCLNSDRFKVTATYDAGIGGSGPAQVVPLTDTTGYLWFFDPSNVEVVVKVINGCDSDGYYWVFAGGLTNVKVILTVTDTETEVEERYINPPNTAFRPIQDTGAFGTCP